MEIEQKNKPHISYIRVFNGTAQPSLPLGNLYYHTTVEPV
jgi:hypothetical protein